MDDDKKVKDDVAKNVSPELDTDTDKTDIDAKQVNRDTSDLTQEDTGDVTAAPSQDIAESPKAEEAQGKVNFDDQQADAAADQSNKPTLNVHATGETVAPGKFSKKIDEVLDWVHGPYKGDK